MFSDSVSRSIRRDPLKVAVQEVVVSSECDWQGQAAVWSRAGPLLRPDTGAKRSEFVAQNAGEQVGFGGRREVSTAIML